MPDGDAIIQVLREACTLLNDPENDFSWSSWEDRDDALREIEEFIARLRNGAPAASLGMGILFAPTGPMQEVSVSSGWGGQFLGLADRFDAAMSVCDCVEAPSPGLVLERDLGMDRDLGEVSILNCQECGRNWVRYFWELEAVTGSGRWFLGTAPRQRVVNLSADEAKPLIEGLEWYFFGGSYFGGTGRSSGRIQIGA